MATDKVTKEVADLKRLTILVTNDLHRWLKGYAVRRETTMTEIILEYLEDLRRKERESEKQEGTE